MAISPQKFREIIFLLLYSLDFGSSSDEEMVSLLMKELAVSKSVMRQAIEVKDEIYARKEEIDVLIAHHCQSYDFERIPRIERNILRLGVFELLYRSDIPGKVAIAEAIRLSRKFSSPESITFVNAIMDAVFQAYGPNSKSLPQAGIDSVRSDVSSLSL